VDSILLAAEQALENSDLDRAVIVLGRLNGPAAEAAGDWLRDSRPRLEVERALAALHGYAISVLARPGPAPGPGQE
jgi:hypothetical protein